jgi:hypothetical protein
MLKFEKELLKMTKKIIYRDKKILIIFVTSLIAFILLALCNKLYNTPKTRHLGGDIVEYKQEMESYLGDAEKLNIILLGGDGAKLLKSAVTNDGDGCYKEFGYDSQNRIIQVVIYMAYQVKRIKAINYINDDLIQIEINDADYGVDTIDLIKNGNEIYFEDFCGTMYDYDELEWGLEESYEIIIDSSGNPLQFGSTRHSGVSTYEYSHGNLKESTHGYVRHHTTYIYKFDDQKSPFTNCSSPKWLIYYLADHDYISVNNWIECDVYDEKYNYGKEWTKSMKVIYVYDVDGFPLNHQIESFSTSYSYWGN